MKLLSINRKTIKMKKIEAETLENALIIASNAFECSVVDLEYEVIQNPCKGFLGIGKKLAIICAQPKLSLQKTNNNGFASKETQVTFCSSSTDEEYLKNIKQDNLSINKASKKESFAASFMQEDSQREILRDSDAQFANKISSCRENRHKEQIDLNIIAKEVQKELKELLALMPYRLSEIFVEPYDENTLYIKIDGEDSALLIGKEGYRYKAISYLIFNWVNHVYGLMIRLEIAEFLRNQEEMIANYLLPTIENIKTYGKAQTKPLDGVLAHIALKQLREQFPDKYISFRLNSEGERYIIINDFHHS